MSKIRGKNKFNPAWLAIPEYKDWLRTGTSTHVRCILCCSDVSIVNGGISNIKSHAKYNPPGKEPTKHQKAAEAQKQAKRSLSVLHFVNSKDSQATTSTAAASTIESTPTTQSASTTAASHTGTLESYIIPISVITAEIRWAMKVVVSHFSFRSCINLSDMFTTMFYDSDVAKGFTLGKTKCNYFITYGLAPIYKKNLIAAIKKSPYFTLHFDESMNKILQTEQMDACIRFWCEKSNMVKSRYLDSAFFNRPNAVNIADGIDNVIKPLSKEAMISLGMDGPHTNWSVVKIIQERRKDDGVPCLESIGSCGLHVVSGSLQTGVQKSSWPLKKVLQSMWKLFHDSPARRDMYIQINESQVFAMRFCPTRWTENEDVAERAISVWDQHVAVIEHYTKLSASKQPKNNSSYDTLRENINDKLMKVKFHIFKDIARKMNKYLKIFQTDAPMVPFMDDVLDSLMRNIMRYFVKRSVLENAETSFRLHKIDIQNNENLLHAKNIIFGTAAKGMLKTVEPMISDNQKSNFQKEYKRFLIGVAEKLKERSPLGYVLIRCASCLDPMKMADDPESCITKFGFIVDKLHEHERLTGSEGDEAKSEYREFLSNVVRRNKDEFNEFDYRIARLDIFLSGYVGAESKKYQHMWKVAIFIFTLSHGQATIERGFNINKEFLIENLEKLSLKSLRIVYDELNLSGQKLHEIPIPRELIISCKEANKKYKAALSEKSKTAAETEIGTKRKLKQEEILQVKRKKADIDKVVKTLGGDINKLCLEASTKNNFEEMKLCLEKSNCFRETLKKKEVIGKELDEVVKKLEEELGNIK